jgi:hypothetical protein
MMKDGSLVVDRFEGGFAVCEQEGGSMVDVERKLLPDDTTEGDVVRVESGVYVIDSAATTERRNRIASLVRDLWTD